jgi:hypothetical protein
MQQIAQNHCGGCTYCCKLLGIKEISKPKGQWCPMCQIGVGCKAYEVKPPSCADYECVWLMSQRGDQPMPLHMRPDKSKVVLSELGDHGVVTAHVEPTRPDAWEEPEMYAVIKMIALHTKVVIDNGKGNTKILIQNAGSGYSVTKRTITMSEPDENGIQHYDPEKQ